MRSRWRERATTLAGGVLSGAPVRIARMLQRLSRRLDDGRDEKTFRAASGRVLDFLLNLGLLKVDTSVVFVLGMHRSGTSCLTGCLEACGLELVNVSRDPRVWNEKGTLEDNRINLLNTSILGRPFDPSWDERRTREVKSDIWLYAQELRGRSRVGLKDPRFLLTLDAWLSCFTSAQRIGVFRNPKAVHESLMKRGEGRVSLERNLSAWKTYNRELLRHYDAQPFPLLCFDWDQERFLRELKTACRFLGLTFNDKPVRSFYESTLKHQRDVSFLDDDEAKRIYDELTRRSKPLKRVFLGGNPSSGTTVLMRALQRLGFSQGPDGEGNFEPNVPEFLSFKSGHPEHNYRSMASFTPEQAWAVDMWIRSYCTNGDCFFEKSPFHMSRFRALDDLYGEDAYFVIIQRDPAQTIASAMRRWGKGSAAYSRPIDRMLQSAIDFDRHDKDKLTNLLYVKYEDFCNRPASIIATICEFLDWPAKHAEIEAVCHGLDVRTPRPYEDITRLGYASSTYEACAQLRKLWGYQAP